MENDDLPRVYPIKYVGKSLLIACWLLLAGMFLPVLLTADISLSELSQPLQITPAVKNLIIILGVAFIMIVQIIFFYKKKASIEIGKRGIRFPSGDFLPWNSIQWYKISFFSDRNNLKRVTFKAKEGYKVRIIVENGKELADIEEEIMHSLQKYNPAAKNIKLKSIQFEAYFLMAVCMVIYLILGVFTGWGEKFVWLATLFLITSLGTIYLLGIYIPQVQSMRRK